MACFHHHHARPVRGKTICRSRSEGQGNPGVATRALGRGDELAAHGRSASDYDAARIFYPERDAFAYAYGPQEQKKSGSRHIGRLDGHCLESAFSSAPRHRRRQTLTAHYLDLIAIDRPSASRQTSAGQGLAQKFGYALSDTGPLFRTPSWLLLRGKIPEAAQETWLQNVLDEAPLSKTLRCMGVAHAHRTRCGPTARYRLEAHAGCRARQPGA